MQINKEVAMRATTVGAVLLAGFFSQAKPGERPSPQRQSVTSANSVPRPVTGQGPWLASCKYWSAVQSAEIPRTDSSPDVELAIHESGNAVESHLKTSISPKAVCGPGSDGWGIPIPVAAADESPAIGISAIVATIPDPIHSHLALDFDRSIDAMLLAAADNGYLSSYYWLPWHSHATSLSDSDTANNAARKDEDSSLEGQPGLIILRYSPDAIDWEKNKDRFSAASYGRVIYLFLVGETPALGVNGTQLQNAFRYEKTLKDDHHAMLSIRPWDLKDKSAEAEQDRLTVIGPFFSGSAASLNEGIEVAKGILHPAGVSISGTTGTIVAARELDPHSEHNYHSFGENAEFEQKRFLQSLAVAGFDLSRVAILSEAGTVFGAEGRFSGVAAGAQQAEDAGPADVTGATSSPSLYGEPTAVIKTPPGVPRPDIDLAKKGTILYLRFPRELSLLRNAQAGQSSKSDSSATPTPYLNLSLKDYSADDTVPRFSTAQSPLSIEAQLMAIAHQLQRARTQFILFSASNILDDIFLAQFLHRACPDARLVVFSGGDLLFERDVDNAPYIGSISISPYLLTSLDFGNSLQWLHSDYRAEATYNAASYAFWDRSVDPSPQLAGYRRYPVSDPNRQHDSTIPVTPTKFLQIPLWASVIGADGYYPLGVLHWCGSNVEAILPTIQLSNSSPPTNSPCIEQESAPLLGAGSRKDADRRTIHGDATQNVWRYVPESINRNSGISPSLAWEALDTFFLVLCMLHICFLWAAQFWSPVTRDLAVDQNDQPHRRSVPLNIGTSVLAAMAFITAYPLISVGRYYHLAFPGRLFAWLTLIAAFFACLSTFLKTWRYRSNGRRVEYGFFNLVSVLALLFTTSFWIEICGSGNLGSDHPSYAGLFFSYRCLQPLSGVCPLLPVLLLLFAWYLWSICQTARLRFSDIHRPRIANRKELPARYESSHAPYALFVADVDLEKSFLYENMTCLLITREVAVRFCANLKRDSRKVIRTLASWIQRNINQVLATVYTLLFALCIFASHIRSLDRFLFTPILAPIFTLIGTSWETHYGPTLYEFLVTALFFPLIMIALSGWFRIILIWGALSRGLLEPLERLPIRFAFTRFKGGNWMSMLNQSGLNIRWRDMSRSTESIRQLVHHPYLQSRPSRPSLNEQYEEINVQIRTLMESIGRAAQEEPDAVVSQTRPSATPEDANPPLTVAAKESETASGARCLVSLWDRPEAPADNDLCSIYSIEEGYATFCTTLLDSELVPYWDMVRIGLVEECSSQFVQEAAAGKAANTQQIHEAKEDETDADEKPKPCDRGFIHLAEELIVVRYVALIRAVLVNIRYLMIFVSASFVLALVTWNSYPFQPHRLINWCFTLLLVIIGGGFIWVFAQMHRNPILSRITDTKPNELGFDFYMRIATFGAVPVLTWLAYQFPELGGTLFRMIQPGLQVMK